ncbi:MAG: hypothetical protein K2Q26_01775 [Bdellovibrionales bacterium]|nr:hypothetical protein [Bdellovibrionales bacterium]
MIALCLFLLSALSSAYGTMPEYNFFSEEETTEVSTSRRIDSEYFSDILAYRNDMQSEYGFLKSERAFFFNVGSLSRSRFSTLHRLKIQQQVSDGVRVQLVYLGNDNLEEQLKNLVLEASFKMTNGIQLIGYTQLSGAKKYNDFGAAVEVAVDEGHTLRLFTTLIDPSFTLRTEESERDLKSSTQYGFVGRWLHTTEENFVEYYGTLQSPLIRVHDDRNTRYEYKESRLGLRGRFGQERIINFDVRYVSRTEGLIDPLSSSADQGIWTRRGLDLLLQNERSSWIYGVAGHVRRWEHNSETLNQQFILPHVWYRSLNAFRDKDEWRLGYEVTLYRMSGEGALFPPTDLVKYQEHRLNARYTIAWSEFCHLHLTASGDVDSFSWEGGNGRLEWYF